MRIESKNMLLIAKQNILCVLYYVLNIANIGIHKFFSPPPLSKNFRLFFKDKLKFTKSGYFDLVISLSD